MNDKVYEFIVTNEITGECIGTLTSESPIFPHALILESLEDGEVEIYEKV
jgi:hypothetical protein